MNKLEIERIVKGTDKSKYSHILILSDHFDYSYYPQYIKRNEDANKIINSINSDTNTMISIQEMYNLNLDIDTQLNEIRAYHIEPLTKKENNEKTKIQEALEYATLMHKGQYRKNGTEYIEHPIKVANYVSRFKESANIETLIIAAYLHDTLEDTEANYYDIVEKFGPQVASIVLELTTDEDLKNEIGKTRYLEIKMKNMSSWALVIKLCDRLANVSDLGYADEKFRNKYMNETIEILSYVIENRNLSKTHITIMIHISQQLFYLNQVFIEQKNEFNEQLSTIQNKIKMLNT